MSEDIKELLQGKFPELKKMKMSDLKEEVQMWRNIWSWIPSAVKYYVSRTGSTIGVTIRNYKRFVGPLLETEWELKAIEIGVYDKVYDQSEGIYFWERKIIKVPIGGIVQFDLIAERVAEDKLTDAIEQAELQPTKIEEVAPESLEQAEQERESRIHPAFEKIRDEQDEGEEDKPPRL